MKIWIRFGRWPRVLFVAASVVLLLWWGSDLWQAAQLRSMQRKCQQLERSGAWTELLVAAREWQRHAPFDRSARIMGTHAAQQLRDPFAAVEFLEHFPRERAGDVEWLSMLADLQLGPLRQPERGAATCEDILRLAPQHQRSHQRLIYVDLMLQRHTALLAHVRRAIEAGAVSPEFVVYAFLADTARWSNGPMQTREWMGGTTSNRSLLIAHSLHVARSLDGSVPSVDESRAAAIRAAQSQRDERLAELLRTYPHNLELQAYHIGRWVDAGRMAAAAELLRQAPPEADQDGRFWRARGRMFLYLNDLTESETSFDRAIRLHPLSWRTWHQIADLRRRQGRMEEAARLQRLGDAGRNLERELMQLPDVRSIPPEILASLAEFAENCGDLRSAQSVRQTSLDAAAQPASHETGP